MTPPPAEMELVERPVRVLHCTANTITVSALERFDNPAIDEDFYLVPAATILSLAARPVPSDLGRLEGLLKRATPVRDGWNLRVKDDGTERYDLIGHPCGFPVATFGDHNDAALDLAFRQVGPSLLATIAADRVRVAEIEAKYTELLFAVSMKSPSETRHETALRYIRQAEASKHGEAGMAARQERAIARRGEGR